MGIAFIASILLARLLGPADRGLLTIMLLASSLPVAFASFGLPMAMCYFVARPETRRGTVLGHSLAYAALLGAVFIPVFTIWGDEIADVIAHGRGDEAWWLVGVLVPVTFLSYTTTSHIWGRLDIPYGTVLMVVSRVLHLGAVVLGVGLLGFGVTGGLMATLLSLGLIFVAGLPILLRDGLPTFHAPSFGRMLRYGVLIQIGTIAGLLNARLDVLVLQHYRPLDEVGHYVVAATVAEVVTILAIGFQGTIMPVMTREGPEGRASASTAALIHHNLLALLAVVAVAVLGPLLVLYVFGPEYRDALEPMFILLPGMVFLGAGMVGAGDLQGRGRPGAASLLALMAAAVTIGLDVAFLPSFGVPGAAVASLIAYVLFGFASVWALARVSGVPVRRLLTPARSDLAAYPAATRRILARIGSRGRLDAGGAP